MGLRERLELAQRSGRNQSQCSGIREGAGCGLEIPVDNKHAEIFRDATLEIAK